MKSGFMLLEVLIALAISSMLSLVLFFSVDQIAKTGGMIDSVIDTHMRDELLMRVLEHDITGAMIVEAPSTKVFFASQKDDNLELLTFITNNPLLLQASSAPVKMVRIVYRLIPAKKENKKEEQSYILTRQELADITFDPTDKESKQEKNEASQEARAYEVVDGILSCKLLFKPRKQEDGQKEEDSKTKEQKEQSTWDSESKIDGKERPVNQLIPQEVTFKVEYKGEGKAKQVFTLLIPILIDTSVEKSAASTSVPSAPQTPNIPVIPQTPNTQNGQPVQNSSNVPKASNT